MGATPPALMLTGYQALVKTVCVAVGCVSRLQCDTSLACRVWMPSHPRNYPWWSARCCRSSLSSRPAWATQVRSITLPVYLSGNGPHALFSIAAGVGLCSCSGHMQKQAMIALHDLLWPAGELFVRAYIKRLAERLSAQPGAYVTERPVQQADQQLHGNGAMNGGRSAASLQSAGLGGAGAAKSAHGSSISSTGSPGIATVVAAQSTDKSMPAMRQL